jgi:hypothetical protein
MSTEEFISWTPEYESNCSSKVVRARKIGSVVYVQYARRANGNRNEKPMLVVYQAPAKRNKS